jgi:hypothetical protein
MSRPGVARAVVGDDNKRIIITVYSADPPYLVAAELEPIAAMRLAKDLFDSALRHIAREVPA